MNRKCQGPLGVATLQGLWRKNRERKELCASAQPRGLQMEGHMDTHTHMLSLPSCCVFLKTAGNGL